MPRVGTTSIPDFRPPVSGPGAAVFVLFLVAGAGLTAITQNPLFFVVAILVGVYMLFSIRVVSQWERVALLRLGKYTGLRGPGTFMLIPIVDTTTTYVDQRVRVSSVSAEQTLTRDTVPVDVDAAIFWL